MSSWSSLKLEKYMQVELSVHLLCTVPLFPCHQVAALVSFAELPVPGLEASFHRCMGS